MFVMHQQLCLPISRAIIFGIASLSVHRLGEGRKTVAGAFRKSGFKLVLPTRAAGADEAKKVSTCGVSLQSIIL